MNELVVEGVPGAGKSTVLEYIADLFAEKYEEVYLNGKQIGKNASEMVLEDDFLNRRYKPDIREDYILGTSSIGLAMAAKRVQTYKKRGMYLAERDAYSANRVFLPSQFAQLKWQKGDWERMAKNYDRAISAIYQCTPARKTVVLYLRVTPETAMKRVMARGREAEIIGLDAAYMKQLCAAHDYYCGECEDAILNVGRLPADREVVSIDTDGIELSEIPLFSRRIFEVVSDMF